MSRSRTIILLIITAMLWSTSGVLIKLCGLPPSVIAAGRAAVSAVFFALVFRKHLSFKPSMPAMLGGLAFVCNTYTFITATKLTTAANAIILQGAAPVYVALLSGLMLKERVRRSDWAIISIVILGYVMFFADRISGSAMLGNVLAIIAGLAFALEILFMRMLKNGKPLDVIFFGCVMAALPLPHFVNHMPPLRDAGIILLLGAVQFGLPFALFSMAIRHVNAVQGAIIPTIEPILNPIWVLLIVGERPSMWALIGGAIVISALIAHAVISARRVS